LTDTAPGLLELYGVGNDSAARLLVAAGDNPDRLRSEAAWARLCGVSPLEASSGKVTRHRLNPGGNRQANAALWHIVITRMSADPRTQAYAERRAEEGRTNKEINPGPQALRSPRRVPLHHRRRPNGARFWRRSDPRIG
jgi:transposase